MKSFPITPKTLERAVKILKKGGVLAHPADTCFGLAGDLKNPKALELIQEIKGRDEEKPMSIMLPTSAMRHLEYYAALDDFSRKVCKKLLPGPVTLLLPKGPKIPKHYFPQSDLIGIRIPDDALMQTLLMKTGTPLITTSANRAGQPLCHTYEEVLATLNTAPQWPDMVLEGQIEKGKASTVILVENGEIKIVREGALSEDDFKKLGFKILS